MEPLQTVLAVRTLVTFSAVVIILNQMRPIFALMEIEEVSPKDASPKCFQNRKLMVIQEALPFTNGNSKLNAKGQCVCPNELITAVIGQSARKCRCGTQEPKRLQVLKISTSDSLVGAASVVVSPQHASLPEAAIAWVGHRCELDIVLESLPNGQKHCDQCRTPSSAYATQSTIVSSTCSVLAWLNPNSGVAL